MIYFLQKPYGGHIKIGTTVCLTERKATLEREHGPLTLQGVMSGSYLEEKDLHRQFSDLQAEGEWFAPHAILTDFIAKHAEPWDGVDERSRQVPVKVEEAIVDDAKVVAAFRKISLAEYVSGVLASVVSSDLEAEKKKPRVSPPKPPKR